VGVHCVDCVREAQQGAAVPRTSFGAPLTTRAMAPVATYTLIGIDVVVYLLQMLVGPSVATELALWTGDVAERPWTLLTAAFLHASWLHLATNMYALWLMGQYLEVQLGRTRFVLSYLVCALGGGVVYTLLTSPQTLSFAVGASGAVFGLFGMVGVVLRRMGSSARGIVVVVAINAVLGFVIPNIAWQAHLGGLVTGVLLGLAMAHAPRGTARRTSWIALAGMTVLLVAVFLIRASTLV
jgi:membrane associated rhomboid family serine protease